VPPTKRRWQSRPGPPLQLRAPPRRTATQAECAACRARCRVRSAVKTPPPAPSRCRHKPARMTQERQSSVSGASIGALS
jgi:hypothetical protein